MGLACLLPASGSGDLAPINDGDCTHLMRSMASDVSLMGDLNNI